MAYSLNDLHDYVAIGAWSGGTEWVRQYEVMVLFGEARRRCLTADAYEEYRLQLRTIHSRMSSRQQENEQAEQCVRQIDADWLPVDFALIEQEIGKVWARVRTDVDEVWEPPTPVPRSGWSANHDKRGYVQPRASCTRDALQLFGFLFSPKSLHAWFGHETETTRNI